MSIWFLLAQPFAQHALLAAALVAVTCGLIAPLVVPRGMSFAVHGTAELAFTGAAASLLVATRTPRQRRRGSRVFEPEPGFPQPPPAIRGRAARPCPA